jgi:hypothetical protein
MAYDKCAHPFCEQLFHHDGKNIYCFQHREKEKEVSYNPERRIGSMVCCAHPGCTAEFQLNHGRQRFCPEHRGVQTHHGKDEKKKRRNWPSRKNRLKKGRVANVKSPTWPVPGSKEAANSDTRVLAMLMSLGIVKPEVVAAARKLAEVSE